MFVGEKISIGVTFIGHRFELDDLEGFSVLSDTRLAEEGRGSGFNSQDDVDGEDEEGDDENEACTRDDEVEGPFNISGVKGDMFPFVLMRQVLGSSAS